MIALPPPGNTNGCFVEIEHGRVKLFTDEITDSLQCFLGFQAKLFVPHIAPGCGIIGLSEFIHKLIGLMPSISCPLDIGVTDVPLHFYSA